MTIEAVIFDLDYTLAVPKRDRQSLLEDATEAVGGPSIDRAAYLEAHRRVHARRTRAPIFERLLDERDSTASPERLAREYRERIARSLVPVPGVEALIDELKRTYAVGLLTNGPIVAQRNKLEVLGWTDRFDATVITGELPAGKPDPRAFEAILSALTVEAGRSVYVGDQPITDVDGAKRAGMFAVQVLYPGGPDRHPRADNAIERSRLVEDLPGVIDGLQPATSVH